MVKGIPRDVQGLYALTAVSKPALLLKIFAQINGHNIKVMIDCAAQGNFMSPSLVDRLRFTVRKKDQAYNLIAIDGIPLLKEDGRVDRETTPLPMLIQQHYETIFFDIIAMARHDVVLGILWLHQHNPIIDWRTRVLRLDRCGCGTTRQPTHR